MPTIFDLVESHLSAESKHLKSPISVPRKSPTKIVHQQDQFKLFEEQDKSKIFDDISSTLTPPGYTFQKYDDLVVFYRIETVLSVTEVTDCVRVNRDLNVKLFYKGSPLLPWFHHGRDCHLTKKSMMQDFLNYTRFEREQTFNILEKLRGLKFKKKITLSNVIRYSSLLRYNSLQKYRLLMKEFPFPSLSLLKKIIFPAFEYDGFKDTILFKGGQTSCKLYHDVLKKIAHLKLT